MCRSSEPHNPRVVVLVLLHAPCISWRLSLCRPQRRRRCLIAPALGRPLNGWEAPDVRAPVVRGRWHFWACFGLYQLPDALVSDPRLGIAGGCGYTLAA